MSPAIVAVIISRNTSRGEMRQRTVGGVRWTDSSECCLWG